MKIDGSVIGHVPDCLAIVLARLLDSSMVNNITGIKTGPPRYSPDGVWVVGEGIELPCEYVLHGAKQDRLPVRATLGQAQNERGQESRKELNKRLTLILVLYIITTLLLDLLHVLYKF